VKQKKIAFKIHYNEAILLVSACILTNDPSVEVGDVRIRNGVGDVVEGIRVDPVVPVHHLVQRLLPLRDLCSGGQEQEVKDKV
jgi:hypothetical protein